MSDVSGVSSQLPYSWKNFFLVTVARAELKSAKTADDVITYVEGDIYKGDRRG